MEDNILTNGRGDVLIFNGGNGLKDCPTSYEQADKITEGFNEGKIEHDEPHWKFDCGFKLDFDGPLLSINSRFYPPKTHYGPTWDGTITVYLMGKEILGKDFNCETLEQLHTEAEAFIKNLKISVQ